MKLNALVLGIYNKRTTFVNFSRFIYKTQSLISHINFIQSFLSFIEELTRLTSATLKRQAHSSTQ